MKPANISVVCIFANFLVGCATIKYSFDLDVEQAVLYSPNGKFIFRPQKNAGLSYLASDGVYTIFIRPLMGIELLKNSKKPFLKSTNKFNIILDSSNTYYKINRHEKQALILIPKIFSHPESKYHHNKFEIVVPASITKYRSVGGKLGMDVEGGGWRKLTFAERSAMDDDIYHYHIILQLDGDKYVIDFKFRLDYQSQIKTTFPGAGVLP